MKGKLIVCFAFVATFSKAIVPNIVIPNYPGIGRMEDVSGATVTIQGTAFAISPYYILTASHVGGNKFEQNGIVYPIMQTISHPTADIAIKRVGTPLLNALPLKTNYFTNGVPVVQTSLPGDICFLQGYGWTGAYTSTGYVYSGENQGILRQGRNRLDLFMPQVTVDLGGGNFKTTDYLIYDLDDPMGQSSVNTLGGPAVGADEAGMYTFDSGCPWTIVENSRPRAVAVGGIIGTFTGSGVTRPLNWGGFGGGANIQTYASWIAANTPDLGRAILEAPTFGVGSLFSGITANLYDSDNVSLTTQTNMSAADTIDNLQMFIRGNTTASPTSSLTLFFEGRCNSSLSVVNVALRNITTGQYVEVGSFLTFANDVTATINISSPNSYVAANGDIDMRIRSNELGADLLFYRTIWDVIRMTAT